MIVLFFSRGFQKPFSNVIVLFFSRGFQKPFSNTLVLFFSQRREKMDDFVVEIEVLRMWYRFVGERNGCGSTTSITPV